MFYPGQSNWKIRFLNLKFSCACTECHHLLQDILALTLCLLFMQLEPPKSAVRSACRDQLALEAFDRLKPPQGSGFWQGAPGDELPAIQKCHQTSKWYQMENKFEGTIEIPKISKRVTWTWCWTWFFWSDGPSRTITSARPPGGWETVAKISFCELEGLRYAPRYQHAVISIRVQCKSIQF